MAVSPLVLYERAWPKLFQTPTGHGVGRSNPRSREPNAADPACTSQLHLFCSQGNVLPSASLCGLQGTARRYVQMAVS
jgi:hypothetical protein